MEVKWVCKTCGSVNHAEKDADTLVCFICGQPYEEKKKSAVCRPSDSSGALPEVTGETGTIKDDGISLGERFKRFVRRFWEGSSDTALPEDTDWAISRSEEKSKEAYVEAHPVYKRPIEVHPDKRIPGESVRKTAAAEKTHESGHKSERKKAEKDPEFEKTWPEHRIKFDTEKLKASGCVSVSRHTMNGVSGYLLNYGSGQRFMTAETMKLMGYATHV